MDNTNENKFVLVKGKAGLGNRMLSALTGILYARLTGRRVYVDWSDYTYSNDGSNAFHRFFQCSLFSPTDEIPETDSVNPSIWRGHLHESVIDMQRPYGIDNQESRRTFSIDLTKLDYQEDVLVLWTNTQRVNLLRIHFTGSFNQFNKASTKDILSKLLREDLTLHPQVRERVNQCKLNWFKQKTVGVHIRYTDRKARLPAIKWKLDALLKREPELQIFLSTDNLEIKKMVEQSYAGVVTTPHWYPTPGSHIHQNQNCSDRMESGIEALVDLYLLAECDYLIIDTSSSLSYVANLLTKAPCSNIFNVNRVGEYSANLLDLMWRQIVRTRLSSWGLIILRDI